VLSAPLRNLLGGQLGEFERARAHFLPREQHTDGELEGFDGLALRGDLSHILQSELLLRTEAPMEFVRRLSEAEALFLNKSFVDPGAHTAYRLIISAGPNLLGHARLAALSALFFFARLAGTRGAKLCWTFAPRREGPIWFEGVTATSLRAFLEAASFRDVNSEDIAALDALKVEKRNSSLTAAAEVDWLLVADGPQRSDAAQRAPRALCLEMKPGSNEARHARAAIVREGRVRRRFSIAFPDDALCLAALREPFAPRVEVGAPRRRAGGKRREPLQSWAPEYFVSLRQGQFLVRFSGGLLVLVSDIDNRADAARFRSYWLDVPSGVKLIGADLGAGLCHAAFQGNIEGQEAIWAGAVSIASGALSRTFVKVLERRFPCRQLFAKQAPFVLPGLDLTRARQVGFYSSLGQVFRGPTWTDAKGVCEVDIRAGKVLLDNGIYRAFWGASLSKGQLHIEKRGRFLSLHQLDVQELSTRAFFGAMFDYNSDAFCFSAEPGRWQVASRRAGATQTFQTNLADQVVSVRPKDSSLEVRLWSDARYGGDGAVRLEEHRNGEVLNSRLHFNFDEVVGTVGKYEVTADGSAWAVTIGDGGDPLSLVRCRRRKKGRDYVFKAYDLEELRREATRLELDVRFD
jgi:hypothetical protein